MVDAAALLLFPGAGSSRDQSSLIALEEALSPLPVARADFPYRKEGRRAPDRAPKLVATVRDEAAALAERTGADRSRIMLGGRSMGGRMCSLAVAGGSEAQGLPAGEGLPAAGLVLISYPLHPPGKPEKLRVDHFGLLDLPCLFISGTRDPFGSPDEMEAHTAAIPGPVTHIWIEAKGHELRNADTQIVEAVQAWLT